MAFPGASRADRPGVGRFRGPSLGPVSWPRSQEHFWAAVTTLAASLLAAFRRISPPRENHDLPGRRRDALHRRQRARAPVDTVPHHGRRLSRTGSTWPFPRRGHGPGVLGVRDHGCRRVGAVRLPVLVHRKGLRAVRRQPIRRRRLGPPRRGWTRVMQLDAWFSMFVFTVATVAFYFLGAAVLHPQGLDPKGPEMIPTLSQLYLQPLEGNAAGLARPLTRESASCWAPGPSCSRRSTSPRPPTAGSRLTSSIRSASGRPRAPRLAMSGEGLLRDLSDPVARALLRFPRAPGVHRGRGHRRRRSCFHLSPAPRSTFASATPTAASDLRSFHDILTWIAFFAISAVAIYSTCGQLPGLFETRHQDVTSW